MFYPLGTKIKFIDSGKTGIGIVVAEEALYVQMVVGIVERLSSTDQNWGWPIDHGLNINKEIAKKYNLTAFWSVGSDSPTELISPAENTDSVSVELNSNLFVKRKHIELNTRN